MSRELVWRLRARLSYAMARRLMGWPWLVRQPRAWQWMQGQFARMAALGHVPAQSFYGHLLLFRGQGQGAREEGLRLLALAAAAGDAKSAYQLGVQALQADVQKAPDGATAARYWEQAAAAGHPLAARRLADLYREGAPGLPVDPALAARFSERAAQLGL